MEGMIQSGRRPYSSDSGDQANGPTLGDGKVSEAQYSDTNSGNEQSPNSPKAYDHQTDGQRNHRLRHMEFILYIAKVAGDDGTRESDLDDIDGDDRGDH
jgi:hypothetical protein